jgi:dihydrofolate reductase
MIALVVATGKNNAIGKDNKLLWHLPVDLKFFKSITLGHPIIMGRTTFDSVGKPLPGRRNIVVSRNKNLKIEGCEVCNSLEDAVSLCKDNETIMIVGGEEIYRQSMQIVDRIYRTLVNISPEADRFFPEINLDEWKLTASDFRPADEKNLIDCTFETYDKIK